MYFHFRLENQKWIGDFLMNRQNLATWTWFYFSFTTRIAFDAPNHPGLQGDPKWTEKNPRNKIWKLLMQQIRNMLPMPYVIGLAASLQRYGAQME